MRLSAKFRTVYFNLFSAVLTRERTETPPLSMSKMVASDVFLSLPPRVHESLECHEMTSLTFALRTLARSRGCEAKWTATTAAAVTAGDGVGVTRTKTDTPYVRGAGRNNRDLYGIEVDSFD